MHLLNPAPFGRILPAMVTPMKADGTVDFEAAQSLAKQSVSYTHLTLPTNSRV